MNEEDKKAAKKALENLKNSGMLDKYVNKDIQKIANYAKPVIEKSQMASGYQKNSEVNKLANNTIKNLGKIPNLSKENIDWKSITKSNVKFNSEIERNLIQINNLLAKNNPIINRKIKKLKNELGDPDNPSEKFIESFLKSQNIKNNETHNHIDENAKKKKKTVKLTTEYRIHKKDNNLRKDNEKSIKHLRKYQFSSSANASIAKKCIAPKWMFDSNFSMRGAKQSFSFRSIPYPIESQEDHFLSTFINKYSLKVDGLTNLSKIIEEFNKVVEFVKNIVLIFTAAKYLGFFKFFNWLFKTIVYFLVHGL